MDTYQSMIQQFNP